MWDSGHTCAVLTGVTMFPPESGLGELVGEGFLVGGPAAHRAEVAGGGDRESMPGKQPRSSPASFADSDGAELASPVLPRNLVRGSPHTSCFTTLAHLTSLLRAC